MEFSEFISDLNEIKVGKYDEINITHNGKLYHYTDTTGLMGIIKSRKFYVSHQKFMNDSAEDKYIYILLRNIFNDFIQKNPKSDICLLYKNIIKEIDLRFEFNNSISYLNKRAEGTRSNVYVLSLTTNADSLTLWSAYSKFYGYSLGFDNEKLDEYFSKYRNITPFASSYVIYELEQQKKIIATQLKEYEDLFYKYFSHIDNKFIDDLAFNFISKMSIYSYYFKDPSFHQEEEYRYTFFYQKNSIDINYRNSNGIIIPYVEIPFKAGTNLPLTDIVVGPKNKSDIAIEGLKYYLHDNHYNIEDISIINSSIPLR